MATTKKLSIIVGIKGNARLQAQLKSIKRGFDRIEKSVFSLKKSVFNLKNAFIGLAGSAGLGLVAKSVIKTSDEFKRYQMTLQALIGNTQKANKEWQILLKFAEQTPYTITDVMQAYKTMVAYGLNPSIQMMKALGDTGAALGKEVLPRLAYALGQIGAASKIRMQDLLQLQNAGINTSKALKEAFGTADLQQLNQKVQQGVISMQQVVQAFVKYMQVHFGGTMQKQMNTLSGQFEILKSYWQEFEDAIMSSGLYAFLVSQMKRINAWIEKLKKSGRFKEWANRIAEDVAHLSGKILVTVGKTIKAFKSIYDWIKSHKTIFEIGLIGLLLFGSRGKALALTALAALNSEKIKQFINSVSEVGNIKVTKDDEGLLEHIKQAWKTRFGFKPDHTAFLNSYHGVEASIKQANKNIKQNTQDTLDFIANTFINAGKRLDSFKAKNESVKSSILSSSTETTSNNTKLQANQSISAVTLNQIKQRLQLERQINDEIIRIEDGPFAYFKQKLKEQVEQFRKAGVSEELIEKYKTAKLEEYIKQHAHAIKKTTSETTSMMQQMWIEASRNMADAFGNFFVDVVHHKMKSLGDYIVGFLNTVRDAMAQMLGSKIGSGIMSWLGSVLHITSSANGNILKGGFRAFATGGIVTEPTLGIIGEGRYNEAVVPLPDGRSIPVKGMAPNVTINVINKGAPATATVSRPQFDGKKWVVNVVMEALHTQPDFRNAVKGVF